MQFRELTGVPPNLPPCLGVTSHMLMCTPSSTTISRVSAFPFGKYVNNEIPSCFNHQRNGNLISFLIGPEFPTIALCVAFQLFLGLFYYHAIISINGSKRTTENIRIGGTLGFERMCFSCSPLQELFEGFNLGDENLVEIFCETSPYGYSPESPNIKWIGVHVQCICPQPQNPVSSMTTIVSNPEAVEFQREMCTNGLDHLFSKVQILSCVDCTIPSTVVPCGQPQVLLFNHY